MSTNQCIKRFIKQLLMNLVVFLSSSRDDDRQLVSMNVKRQNISLSWLLQPEDNPHQLTD